MTSMIQHLTRTLSAGLRDEAGGISVLNVFLTMTLALFGGIAIDVASLTAARTQLQVAADSAAHAALYKRMSNDADTARQEAMNIALANMPKARYGDVLQIENIHFGTYDPATDAFTIDETKAEAVLVETNRLIENDNPVTSFLLQFAGFWEWDVRARAVFARPELPCIHGGFIAHGRVDMQSNNAFYNGFCVHSDQRVEFNQNNFFDYENGVRVMTPTIGDVVVPGGNFDRNPGLADARRAGGPYNIDVDRLIDEIIAGLTDVQSPHFRPYIYDLHIEDVTPGSGSGDGLDVSVNVSVNIGNNGKGKNKKGGDSGGGGNGGGNGGGGGNGELSMADLTPGRIHRVSCSGDTLNVAGEVFREVVVITDCNFAFSNGSALEDAIFITESTDATTIKAPQGLRIGYDDSCALGGGAQLISRGGMRTAAKLQLYGGQIIVGGDLKFAAQGNGFGGASVIAGGEIDGTSNSTMGLCTTGMEDFFEVRDRPRLRG